MEALCGLARGSNGWHNWRSGGPIRGKWRILDGKEGEWSDLKFGSGRLRTDRLAVVSKSELCTGAYGILWGPTN
jgi:hypothetical protein